MPGSMELVFMLLLAGLMVGAVGFFFVFLLVRADKKFMRREVGIGTPPFVSGPLPFPSNPRMLKFGARYVEADAPPAEPVISSADYDFGPFPCGESTDGSCSSSD